MLTDIGVPILVPVKTEFNTLSNIFLSLLWSPINTGIKLTMNDDWPIKNVNLLDWWKDPSGSEVQRSPPAKEISLLATRSCKASEWINFT